MLTSFVARHIGPSDSEIAQMLKEIGIKSLDELLTKRVVVAEARVIEFRASQRAENVQAAIDKEPSR